MIPSINPLVLNLKESATLSINMTVKRMRSESLTAELFPGLVFGCDRLAENLDAL